jgi:hypothetical protein
MEALEFFSLHLRRLSLNQVENRFVYGGKLWVVAVREGHLVYKVRKITEVGYGKWSIWRKCQSTEDNGKKHRRKANV